MQYLSVSAALSVTLDIYFRSDFTDNLNKLFYYEEQVRM